MAITLTSSTTAIIGAAASTWSIGLALSSGDFPVIGAGAGSSANVVSTVTDNGGNVYVRAVANSTAGGPAAHAEIWYCQYCTAPSTRVKMTWSAASSGALCLARYFGGSTVVGRVLNQTGSTVATANSTTWSAQSITPTYGNSLVFMVDRLTASTLGTANVSAGYTWLSTVGRTFVQYQVQGASSATDAAWTTSSRAPGHAAVIASFVSDTVVFPLLRGWCALPLLGVQ